MDYRLKEYKMFVIYTHQMLIDTIIATWTEVVECASCGASIKSIQIDGSTAIIIHNDPTHADCVLHKHDDNNWYEYLEQK
jgi:hypothetical protein